MSKLTKLAIHSATLAIVLMLSAGLYGSEEKKGTLESAGEKVDEAVSDAKREVEDAAD